MRTRIATASTVPRQRSPPCVVCSLRPTVLALLATVAACGGDGDGDSAGGGGGGDEVRVDPGRRHPDRRRRARSTSAWTRASSRTAGWTWSWCRAPAAPRGARRRVRRLRLRLRQRHLDHPGRPPRACRCASWPTASPRPATRRPTSRPSMVPADSPIQTAADLAGQAGRGEQPEEHRRGHDPQGASRTPAATPLTSSSSSCPSRTCRPRSRAATSTPPGSSSRS